MNVGVGMSVGVSVGTGDGEGSWRVGETFGVGVERSAKVLQAASKNPQINDDQNGILLSRSMGCILTDKEFKKILCERIQTRSHDSLSRAELN